MLTKALKKIPRGFYELYADLEKTDKEGIAFYKKHGFKLAGKVKGWFGNNSVGLFYSKILNKELITFRFNF